MKKTFFILSFFALTFSQAAVSFNQTEIVNNQAEALKRIKVNEYIKDTKGNTWHIYGWVDVSIGWGGVEIVDYDIHMVSGNTHYHFQGRIASQRDEEGGVRYTLSGNLTDVNSGTEVEIDDNIKSVLYNLHESIIRNNS